FVYVPLGAETALDPSMAMMVKSEAGPAAVAAILRDQVRALDPDLPVYAIDTLDGGVAQARAPQRLMGTWFGTIALIALVLASVGVYGLTAHGVAQRTQEVGVRMALGARGSHVV